MNAVNVVAVLALMGLLIYLFGWSANFQEPRSGRDMLSGGDYLQFFAAGQLVQRGQADRLYDFEHFRAFQHDPDVIPYDWDPNVFGLYMYPPFFVWYCLPFSMLPFHLGAIVWVVAMSGFLVAAVVLMQRAIPGGRGCFGWLLLGCLIYRPAVMSLYTGQNATLSLFILALCYFLFQRGRPGWAGAVFALLAFKPQLTLVIGLGMLCSRQWRFVAGAIGGGLLLVGASLAVSPSATLEYLRVAPSMSKWIDMPGMPIERMSCWYGFWRLALAGYPLSYAQAATAVMSAVTLIPLVHILRHPVDSDPARMALRFAALVIATVALSPHLLSYDLTVLLLPILLLATTGLKGQVRAWAVIVFLAASFSEALAASTGVQVIVPLLVLTLVLLAKIGAAAANATSAVEATYGLKSAVR